MYFRSTTWGKKQVNGILSDLILLVNAEMVYAAKAVECRVVDKIS
jgi:hypothetical protein